jgi:hypothetical protein
MDRDQPTLELSETQVSTLAAAVRPFLDTRAAPPGVWRGWDEERIWWTVVGQVAVVGSSAAWERIQQDAAAGNELAWTALRALDDRAALRAIHAVFRRHGVRYVSADASKDRKSEALVCNLRVLEAAGGPKQYVAALSELPDEMSRVENVRRDLGYIKDKGARDLLISLGLACDVVALDARISRVLRALGVSIGAGSISASAYRSAEHALRAVRPKLGVSSLSHLDRILYRHADAVVAALAGGDSGRRVAFVLADDDFDELCRRAVDNDRDVSSEAMAICGHALRQGRAS